MPSVVRRREDSLRLLWISGIDGFCHRYEVLHRVAQARLLGARSTVRHFADARLASDAERCDVLLAYRTPATPLVEHAIERARRRGVPVLGTVDDLIFLPEDPATLPATLAADERPLWLEGVRRYRRVLDACDGFIAPTEPLRDAASALGWRTWLHRDALSAGELALGAAARRTARSARARAAGECRVVLGYFSGTPTHDRDFAQILPALLSTLTEHRNVELVVVGPLALDPAFRPFAGRVRRLPLVPWPSLPRLIAAVDVSLAPLELGSAFAAAKGEVKYLEAGAVGVPTVASPTPAFAHAIESGVNGWLAGSASEWQAALALLAGDADLRLALGEAARRDVERRFAPEARARELREILHDALAGRAVRRPAPGTDASSAPPWPGGRPALEPDATLDLELPPSGAVSPPLAAGARLRQSFRARREGVFRIDLSTVTYGQRLTHRLTARLCGAAGRLVIRRVRATAHAADRSWWSFVWPASRLRRGERCVLELAVDGSGPGDALSFALAEPGRASRHDAGRAELAGRELGAPLAFRTFAPWSALGAGPDGEDGGRGTLGS